MRDESGFTLIESLVVLVVMGVLLAVAVGFHGLARERAGDATAKMNLHVAAPALEAYRADTGAYTDVTLALLRASYSPGITGIGIVSADASGYCVRSTTTGRTWYREGPRGAPTTTPCS